MTCLEKQAMSGKGGRRLLRQSQPLCLTQGPASGAHLLAKFAA